MEDILLTELGELSFAGGDLEVGESSLQHQKLLLQTFKGDWRERPDVGVGIFDFLKDEDEGSLLPEIKEQFERDGMIVRELGIENGHINCDAYYR